MITRDLTPDERTAFDTLWATCLSVKSTCVSEAQEAWDKYVTDYSDMGIVPTLAGYRVKQNENNQNA